MSDQRLLTKPDWQHIFELIPAGSRVLDLGCGDGSLLASLRDEKQCFIQGIDISQEQVIKCISKGVPVIQDNLNTGLSCFPDNSFDYAILGQTFQQVLAPEALIKEMNRVAKLSVVSVYNLGYWRSRFQIAFGGHMPMTEALPHEWYNSPNIHLGTRYDFRDMCQKNSFTVVEEHHFRGDKTFLSTLWPNLFADLCLFILKK